MALNLNIVLLATALLGVSAYYDLKEPSYISDALLRDLFADVMGKDLVAEASDEYMDDEPAPMSNARLSMMARATKDQNERLMDYDSLLDRAINPHPSLRDSEYMQHNSLFGAQFMSGGAGEGPHLPKPQVKTDALPAYCNPPNPCPVGYSEDQGCTIDFENTASFSREYQAAQECMCDSEHVSLNFNFGFEEN
jgi:hypothetical protein